MTSRPSFPALFLLTLAAALPARADSTFATKRYEITLSDGWQPMASPTGNDSTLALMYGYSMMGYGYLTTGMEGDPATAARLDAFREPFAGSDSMAKVAVGSATLGGKTFAIVEFKSTDSANADIRFRYYTLTEGPQSFTAAFIYDVNSGIVLVPDFEAALATLSFATTPIRPWVRQIAPDRMPTGYDLLGRPVSGAIRMAAFRLPAR
jgi:hypothetical protein